MSASARATPRRWALSSLHGAEFLAVPADAVAAGCLAVVAAAGRHQPQCGDGERESPVTDGRVTGSRKGNRDIPTEL
jgi:hypothetical protein